MTDEDRPTLGRNIDLVKFKLADVTSHISL